jgi:hypothetical protein
MKHSPVGASGAYRWLACPASVKLAGQCPPQEASSFAQEGTLAHEYAELLLQKSIDDMAPDLLTSSHSSLELKEFLEENNIDSEMKENIQIYVDYILSLLEDPESKDFLSRYKVGIEAKFSLEWIHREMFGTNDCYVYDRESFNLKVIDLKYGKGIYVDPKYNPQLMIYALGAVHDLITQHRCRVETVDLVIVQPRKACEEGPIRSFRLKIDELTYWANNVLRPGVLETESPNARIAAGNHCRFCPALAICPEHTKKAYEMARSTFGAKTLPSPENLTPNDIERVLEASELFSKWSEEVRKYAYAMIESGRMSIPNYKLVQKRANRKWVDDKAALDLLHSLLGDNAVTSKVISPSQAEKLLKKLNIKDYAELINNISKKESSGLTLVHKSDKRQEVNPQRVRSSFINFMDIMQ